MLLNVDIVEYISNKLILHLPEICIVSVEVCFPAILNYYIQVHRFNQDKKHFMQKMYYIILSKKVSKILFHFFERIIDENFYSILCLYCSLNFHRKVQISFDHKLRTRTL